MAPTICSGKKRQTRTIATTEIRRHGQRSQLNQALSNIVNYVARGSTNPRVSASLRIQTHNPAENNTTGNQHQHHNANIDASTNNTNNNNHSHKHSIQTSATLAANHRRQQFSSISDNAVTSSTHSDTENSYDLRLTNETIVNMGSTTTNSSSNSNINPSSLSFPSTSSSSSHKEMSSPTCEERRFQRYSSSATSSSVSHVQANDLDDEIDVTDVLYKDEGNNNYSALNTEANKKHSKHFYKYSDDDDEDMMNNDDFDSTYASDTDSMTSLDTEKSAELKRGNHPQWRDKYCTKSLTNASSSNTDGLLSIAIKTIKLVKRNQLLQQRLTQLQLETSEFIESVLANPENRHFRENIKQKVKEVENV